MSIGYERLMIGIRLHASCGSLHNYLTDNEFDKKEILSAVKTEEWGITDNLFWINTPAEFSDVFMIAKKFPKCFRHFRNELSVIVSDWCRTPQDLKKAFTIINTVIGDLSDAEKKDIYNYLRYHIFPKQKKALDSAWKKIWTKKKRASSSDSASRKRSKRES